MSAAPLPALRERLAKVCELFGSDHDGERSAAAYHAHSIVKGAGLTWHELIVREHRTPRPVSVESLAGLDWRFLLVIANSGADWLTPWEDSFLASLARQRSVTRKQRRVLEGIAAKVLRHREAS